MVFEGFLEVNTNSLPAAGGVVNLRGLVFDQDLDGTYAGVIAGPDGRVFKRGSGMVTFNQANFYTNNTNIEGGTLDINHDDNLGIDSSKVVSAEMLREPQCEGGQCADRIRGGTEGHDRHVANIKIVTPHDLQVVIDEVFGAKALAPCGSERHA